MRPPPQQTSYGIRSDFVVRLYRPSANSCGLPRTIRNVRTFRRAALCTVIPFACYMSFGCRSQDDTKPAVMTTEGAAWTREMRRTTSCACTALAHKLRQECDCLPNPLPESADAVDYGYNRGQSYQRCTYLLYCDCPRAFSELRQRGIEDITGPTRKPTGCLFSERPWLNITAQHVEHFDQLEPRIGIRLVP